MEKATTNNNTPIIKLTIPEKQEKREEKPVKVLNYSNLKKWSKEMSMEDLSIKKEESIDASLKDKKEEEVEESIEESTDQRKIRRTTLQNELFGVSERPSIFPESVDIRNLEGNIFLREKLIFCSNVEVIKLHGSDRTMLKKLQLSFRRVNSYCDVFNRKANVLVSILLDLLTKYTEGVHKKIYYFDRLKDVYSPWMKIVVNSTVKNYSEIESQKINSKEESKNLGLLAPNSLTPQPLNSKGSPERKRAISRNLAFDAISLIKAMPQLVNKKSKEEEEEIEFRRSRSFEEVGRDEVMEAKEEIMEFENRRRTKSVEYDMIDISECTRLNFLRKYKSVLKENKKMILNLNKWKQQLNFRINNLLNGGEIKDILVKINSLLKEFSVIFSKNIRWLVEGEQIYNNLNPDRSLFILEMKICTLMGNFRRILDHKLIETISELNKEVGSIILPHSEFLIKESKALDQIGSMLYGESEWNSEPLKNPLVSKKFQPFNMFKMISPQFRKYMKLKLKLQKNSVVKNEDLIDFFKFYRIKYLKRSPFLANYIKCYNKASKNMTQKDFCLLCLDIFGNISLLIKKSNGNSQFQYPLSLGLFLSSLHVIITLEEKTSEIVLKYSPGGMEIGKTSNKSVKVKKVALQFEDKSECVQFLKCFYSLQKIRFDNRGKGKGKSAKRKPRVI